MFKAVLVWRWVMPQSNRADARHRQPRGDTLPAFDVADIVDGCIAMTSIFDFSARTLAGQPVSLADFQGKVLLIVNTASKCGFTPQYAGLQQLHEKYRDQGLVVMGFPCNQFGQQEPGDSQDIARFCETTFGVDFPIFEKIQVNGAGAHPLFTHLKAAAPGLLGSEAIKWNFTKFLVGKDGAIVKRFAPQTAPEDLQADIEQLLQA
jgi:glutathione peroxidase